MAWNYYDWHTICSDRAGKTNSTRMQHSESIEELSSLFRVPHKLTLTITQVGFGYLFSDNSAGVVNRRRRVEPHRFRDVFLDDRNPKLESRHVGKASSLKQKKGGGNLIKQLVKLDCKKNRVSKN